MEDKLAGEDIVCFGTSKWDFVWHPDKHTMKELSRANRVIYIEPGTSLLSPLRTPGQWSGWTDFPMKLRKVGKNFYVLSHPPILLPFPSRSEAVTFVNGKIFAALIKTAMKRLGFQRPILWSYLHHYEGRHLVGNIDRKLLVYDCIDEYSSYTPDKRSRDYIRRTDRWMCENADIVFTVSKNLQDSKKQYNSNTYHIPNAVDLSHFRSSPQGSPYPEDMKAIKPPVVGLIGQIDFRMSTDMELIKYTAGKHPEWSIVLIGPVEHEPDREMMELSNIHFLGPRKVEELPPYIRHFDVCIMPYLMNDFTKYNCPQKLFEYLAAGKPVVTTSVPALGEFCKEIRISSDRDEFVLNIEEELIGDDEGAVLRRREIAELNTWESRVKEKSRLVAKMINAGQA